MSNKYKREREALKIFVNIKLSNLGKTTYGQLVTAAIQSSPYKILVVGPKDQVGLR